MPDTIDDQALYRIRVKRAIVLDPPIGQVVLSPGSDNVVKGKLLKTLNQDDIDVVEPA
jgi:hypothetical protein